MALSPGRGRRGGTQRCTARSKLPGINLEVTARRMECGGWREGRLVAGADEALVHLAEEWNLKEQAKGERDERKKSRERDRCQLTGVKKERKISTNIWH